MLNAPPGPLVTKNRWKGVGRNETSTGEKKMMVPKKINNSAVVCNTDTVIFIKSQYMLFIFGVAS